MKKVLIAVTVLGIVIGSYWLSSKEEIIRVELATAEKGEVIATVANTRAGTVTACKRSRLSLPIGGQINKLYVMEGNRVEAGQLLLELWNKDAKAQLNAAKAGERSAVQEKNSLCIAAKADLRESLRQQEVFEKKLTSEEKLDRTQARAESSQAACDAANARYHQSSAQRQLAQAILDKTYLYAPFAGTVAEVTGEIGEFTTPSPPGVATPPAIDLLTDDCHYVTAPIDEVDAAKIELGMTVTVTLDSFRNRPLSGLVRRISPYVQDYAKQARTVEIEVELDTITDLKLLAGYSADVEILLAQSQDTLKIPTDAILKGDSVEGDFVWRVNTEGIIERRTIKTGLQNWQDSEILDGLAPGDTVVIAGGRDEIVAGARVEQQ